MKINHYQLINVFTSAWAKGNQCCVLRLDDINDDSRLLKIAGDINMPATAFIQQISEQKFKTRWFAPQQEIDLCGHGSLATAWAILDGKNEHELLILDYNQGSLNVSRNGEKVSLSSSPIRAEEAPIPLAVQLGFGNKVKGYFPSANKHLVLFENAEEIAQMKPDWDQLRKSNVFSYTITAKGDDCDFVSRTLLPFISQLEDQATGSSHLTLAPFWSERLGKTKLHAKQLSERGGEMHCLVNEEKIILSASCKLFATGIISL